MKTYAQALKILEDVAQEVNGKVYRDYSGRGMFGRQCPGIVCNDATEVIELCALKGLRKSSQDSMGLQVIVYFPSIIKDKEIKISNCLP